MKVGVIILNFRVKEETLNCLKSVKASSYESLQVFVIDNNSGDNLEKELPDDVIFIQSNKNLGYTGGNNLGIKRALDLGVDSVFIINPDLILLKDTITNLVDGLNLGADIVGPKIYFPRSKKIWYAGGEFDKLNILGKHRGVDEIDKGQFNETEETDFVTGAAILIKKKVFDTIGLFDERFFLYYEDSDFCFRAKKAGFKIMYIPRALAYHENARSTGLGSPLQDYYITRNRLLFAFKHLPFRTKFALIRETLRNLANPTRRLAFFDFLRGNFGKGSF